MYKRRLGGYIESQGPLHRVSPMFKFLILVLVVVASFISSTWVTIGVIGGYVIALCLISQIPFQVYATNLKYFTWMFGLAFALNVIFPRDPTLGRLTPEAVEIGAIFAIRLGYMILVGVILCATTEPSEIGDLVLVGSKVGGRLGKKLSEFGTILTIALRFVPVMLEEAERIDCVQRLRGRRSHTLTQKISSAIALIVPLLESTLRRANNLAYALEARCYGYRLPTVENPRFSRADFVFVITGLLIFASVLVLR